MQCPPNQSASFETHEEENNRRKTLLLILLLAALERLLDKSNQAAQGTKQLSEAEAPALDAHSVDEEVHQGPVGDNKDAEDSEISPCLTSLDVQR
jgi:hypothetical protein